MSSNRSFISIYLPEHQSSIPNEGIPTMRPDGGSDPSSNMAGCKLIRFSHIHKDGTGVFLYSTSPLLILPNKNISQLLHTKPVHCTMDNAVRAVDFFISSSLVGMDCCLQIRVGFEVHHPLISQHPCLLRIFSGINLTHVLPFYLHHFLTFPISEASRYLPKPERNPISRLLLFLQSRNITIHRLRQFHQ